MMGANVASDDLDKVEKLAQEALKLKPEERGPFLDQACGDDPELLDKVESLLSHHFKAPTDFMQPPDFGEGGGGCGDDGDEAVPGDVPDDDRGPDPNIGKAIGQFHVKSVIGSGGFGTVYWATQQQPRRNVALKLMKRGVTSRSALRRFKFEAQLLARLRHPGIAQVYETGTHDEGEDTVPYFAMEYVPGALSLTTYAREKKLDTQARLELFTDICDAVAHGHQKGIIHRDLKPGNILVDSTGRPKIIDFGVARATDSDLTVTTLQTDLRQIIGTLQYMSPEQCGDDALDIDTSSDVYALGVVLYELVCDELPYVISEDTPVPAAVMTIRTQEPTRPSAFNRSLRGDVETIVLKALSKERDRRYRSAAELGDDICRFLSNEPIVARPPSVIYLLRMFARRNRAVFSAISVAIVVLVAAVVFSTAAAVIAMSARSALEVQREIAVQRAAEALEAQRVAERSAYRANIAAARS
jgi:non-specific serine/threonine protein kinase/serine/threonine-protein kinase